MVFLCRSIFIAILTSILAHPPWFLFVRRIGVTTACRMCEKKSIKANLLNQQCRQVTDMDLIIPWGHSAGSPSCAACDNEQWTSDRAGTLTVRWRHVKKNGYAHVTAYTGMSCDQSSVTLPRFMQIRCCSCQSNSGVVWRMRSRDSRGMDRQLDCLFCTGP